MSNRYDRGISSSPEKFPKPELRNEWLPVWFNAHGLTMKLVKEEDEGYDSEKVTIKNKSAEVVVSKHEKYDRFAVDWNIKYSQSEYVQGRTLMRSEQLKQAFGLSDNVDSFGTRILKDYGGTTGFQGEYLRYEKYLNIPGPGTGREDDPNVSIELDENIKSAVRILVFNEFVRGKYE